MIVHDPASVERKIARKLREAYRQGAIAPFGGEIGHSIDAAYRIQTINTRHAVETAGRKPIGRKIGLTSKAVQAQLKVDQPDYGVLFLDMEVPDGGVAEINDLLQPRIEAEVAFCFGKTVDDPTISASDLVGYVDWVAPALEIVDSRVADWRIGIAETIADNASSGKFVIGRRIPLSRDIDVVNCAMEMFEGTHSEPVSRGFGYECLGSPYIATHWLALKMIERGSPIEAGEVVLSGALGPMVAVESRQSFLARISGLGAVRVSFTGRSPDRV